jgi:hypothetical protein
LKGLREFAADQRVRRRVVVSLDDRARRTDDGIEILRAQAFAERLRGGGG